MPHSVSRDIISLRHSDDPTTSPTTVTSSHDYSSSIGTMTNASVEPPKSPRSNTSWPYSTDIATAQSDNRLRRAYTTDCSGPIATNTKNRTKKGKSRGKTRSTREKPRRSHTTGSVLTSVEGDSYCSFPQPEFDPEFYYPDSLHSLRRIAWNYGINTTNPV